ncbi:LytTR family two component transcriptional regulator [Enterobacter cancerogenus]|uniref:LytTR family two component transcriptional regulator n=1 Tax=Enterobacter cancerogenus TaxID=69218 RepID=A0A484Z819_9ENTR|nr:LytTR family two component transcriptional regulator [Enterobacter cancerogenus]
MIFYYAEAHEKMTFVYTRRESYVMAMNITEFCSKTACVALLPLPPVVLREFK